ncbi:acyltransferase family protein [Microbacterium sulfonylureivorans]|uniref:acyltransferase family protein n=1 Tax=Microbacterium sulfonylureivorans TaxID=2486854 RepID=UPI0013DFFE0F|nr:acyltransferase family protein [Microbacterium sulfonylureivorans]
MPSDKPRERWIDVAKGIAIILVVFLHAAFPVVTDVHVWHWVDYSAVLESFRMPLFFFMAGIFASRVLAMRLRDVIDLRVLKFSWLYVLWSIITGVVVVWGVFHALQLPGHVGELLMDSSGPNGATWFIFAIALYFLVGWFARKLPFAVQLSLAFVLTMLCESGLVVDPASSWGKVGKYFFFFLLAAQIGPRLREFVPRLRLWHTLIAPVVYAALVVVARWQGWLGTDSSSAQHLVVWFLLSVLAVAAGCSAAVLLARWAAFDWLFQLGSRTLYVYLLQWYPLAAGWLIISSIDVIPPLLEPFLVPLLTAFAIVVSLIIHRLTKRAAVLYDQPAWLHLPRRWVTRAEGPASVETAAADAERRPVSPDTEIGRGQTPHVS